MAINFLPREGSFMQTLGQSLGGSAASGADQLIQSAAQQKQMQLKQQQMIQQLQQHMQKAQQQEQQQQATRQLAESAGFHPAIAELLGSLKPEQGMSAIQKQLSPKHFLDYNTPADKLNPLRIGQRPQQTMGPQAAGAQQAQIIPDQQRTGAPQIGVLSSQNAPMDINRELEAEENTTEMGTILDYLKGLGISIPTSALSYLSRGQLGAEGLMDTLNNWAQSMGLGGFDPNAGMQELYRGMEEDMGVEPGSLGKTPRQEQLEGAEKTTGTALRQELGAEADTTLGRKGQELGELATDLFINAVTFGGKGIVDAAKKALSTAGIAKGTGGLVGKISGSDLLGDGIETAMVMLGDTFGDGVIEKAKKGFENKFDRSFSRTPKKIIKNSKAADRINTLEKKLAAQSLNNPSMEEPLRAIRSVHDKVLLPNGQLNVQAARDQHKSLMRQIAKMPKGPIKSDYRKVLEATENVIEQWAKQAKRPNAWKNFTSGKELGFALADRGAIANWIKDMMPSTILVPSWKRLALNLFGESTTNSIKYWQRLFKYPSIQKLYKKTLQAGANQNKANLTRSITQMAKEIRKRDPQAYRDLTGEK